jgi:hypothetical protein
VLPSFRELPLIATTFMVLSPFRKILLNDKRV